MKHLLLILSLFSSLAFGFSDSSKTDLQQTKHFLMKEGTDSVVIGYLVYLPKGYESSKESWPMILFVHGGGERGYEPDTLRRHGLPKLIEKGMNLPFIVVSPQCPPRPTWPKFIDSINVLLNKVIKEYKIDTTRIYLTGLSMGGIVTWNYAEIYPDRFAAIAPLCGWGDTTRAAALKDLPIWAFHGAKDTLAPLQGSTKMKELVEKAGGKVKLTIYPDLGHSIWRETYSNPELYDWFLQHKRK
jgi:predicted peptidase